MREEELLFKPPTTLERDVTLERDEVRDGDDELLPCVTFIRDGNGEFWGELLSPLGPELLIRDDELLFKLLDILKKKVLKSKKKREKLH